MTTSIKSMIKDICNNNSSELLSFENVNGIGLGEKYTNGINTNELCLHVLVEKKMDKSDLSSKHLIPKKYLGITTDILEVGELKAHALTSRVRPLKFGYSIAPNDCNYAGTLGCLVKRETNGNIEYFILSNNHVLANSNIKELGSLISQPAVPDGGSKDNDVVANLSEFIGITFTNQKYSTSNYFDCALAKINNNDLIDSNIYSIGIPKGINKTPTINLPIKKSGRTTGFTSGNILTTYATVNVGYSLGTATFSNQLLATSLSSPGDSGSLVLDTNNYAVGLLFAGSSQITVINRIDSVLDALNVTLVTEQ